MKRAVAIVLVLMIIFSVTGCSGEPRSRLPERLSLYISGERRIVTITPEEYLTGCILAVCDPSFQPEALKAVGAACCGKALYAIQNAQAGEFMGADLNDAPAECSAWLSPEAAAAEYPDLDEHAERIAQAVGYAVDTYMEYDGVPAFTPVFRCSSGVSDAGGMPYLVPLELPGDSADKWYSAVCTVPSEYARKALRKYTGSVVLPPKFSDWFTDEVRTPAGTLVTVRFGGAEITGSQLQEAFGLRSCAISIIVSGDEFMLTSLGCGGNIGMSAYGAERMARSGMSAEEILELFYPGANICR